MRIRHYPLLLALFALLVPLTGQARPDSATSAPRIEIPNARQPAPHLLTGGQPSLENLEAAAAQGYALVINLRAPAEMDWDEASAAHKLGLDYLNIPIAGANDINQANAQALDAALRLTGDRPVLLHCASGNRAGALLALRAGLIQQAGEDKALALGKAAGMTHLEGRVKQVLDAARKAN